MVMEWLASNSRPAPRFIVGDIVDALQDSTLLRSSVTEVVGEWPRVLYRLADSDLGWPDARMQLIVRPDRKERR